MEPGEFRRSQNWIGGTRPGNAAFVPPPPDLVLDCMGDLELFLHEKGRGLPLLIKAGIAHVQFETIHPFLDRNGRVGRLLITFLLCAHGTLHEPILYLSLYFKTRRDVYYDLLNRVRTTGDWEAWLEFFLTGVKETAEQAGTAARRIVSLFEDHRDRIDALGRPAASVLRGLSVACNGIRSYRFQKPQASWESRRQPPRRRSSTCKSSASCAKSPAASAIVYLSTRRTSPC